LSISDAEAFSFCKYRPAWCRFKLIQLFFKQRATMFALDIYKARFNPDASDQKLISVSKISGTLLASQEIARRITYLALRLHIRIPGDQPHEKSG